MNVLSSDKKSQTFILIGRRRKGKIRKHFYLGFVEQLNSPSPQPIYWTFGPPNSEMATL